MHHLEFCASDVEEVNKQLKEAGVPLLSDKPFVSQSMPWQQSILISPKKTHGVLVKVATKYCVENGQWVPAKAG